MNNSKIEDFKLKIQEISNQLEQNKELIVQDTVDTFSERVSAILPRIDTIITEKRKLRIGIVGCVKAGKSSFLNALIFEGKDILPKAVTPMTAALTKLNYAKKPCAKVVFFTSYDWKAVEDDHERFENDVNTEYSKLLENCADETVDCLSLARKNALDRASDRLKANVELYQMVRSRNLNEYHYLDKTHTIEGASAENPEEYLKHLEQYVGEHGLYTPLVNYIELSINHPALKDLEIIDTPGLDDPVISRSNITEKFLIECDVVLVLSPITQFFTGNDMELLTKKLKQASIPYAYLIGSKLDLGMLQYSPTNRTLTLMDVWKRCQMEQTKSFNSRTQNANSPILNQLRKNSPLYVSAQLCTIGHKMARGETLNEDETFTLSRLKTRFCDYDQILSDHTRFHQCSRYSELTKKLDEVHQNKESTISAKKDDFLSSQPALLIKALEEISNSVKSRRSELENTDMQTLVRKQEELGKHLDRIRPKVISIFSDQISKCNKDIQSMKLEILKENRNHKDLFVSHSSRDEFHTEHYGLFGMMQRTYTITIHDSYADSNEVVANLRNYYTRIEEICQADLEKMFDQQQLKEKVAECISGAFDFDRTDFNKEEIVQPIESLFYKLTIKKFDVHDLMENIEPEVYNKYPHGKVCNDQIGDLATLQSKLMGALITQSCAKLDDINNNIRDTMHEQAGTFVDEIEKMISKNIDQTKRLLENRQDSINRLNGLVEVIKYQKSALREFLD